MAFGSPAVLRHAGAQRALMQGSRARQQSPHATFHTLKVTFQKYDSQSQIMPLNMRVQLVVATENRSSGTQLSVSVFSQHIHNIRIN